MVEIVATLALALGASWCAGINLYATLFVLGAMARWTTFTLPPGLDVLTSDWVMWPALALYCVEFAADKFPAIDTTWDTIQTFLRIPAGAVLAATALGDVPLEIQLAAGLVGGFMATTSHTAKATTRVAAHATGTSPVVSPTASVVEDVAVVGTLAALLASPWITLALVFVMLVAAIVVIVVLWKIARRIIRRLFRPPAPPPPAVSVG